MRIRDTDKRRVGLAAFVLAVFPTPAHAQPSDITATVTHAHKKPLELSGTLLVTLAVEGPAPLRVEFYTKRRPDGSEVEQLLAEESNREWKIGRAGPARKTPLGKDRERWVQEFRLDPYVARGATTILFAPLRVNGREVPGPGCGVTVAESKIEAKPGAAMTITGIEEIPPPPRPSQSWSPWWWAAGAVLAVAVLVLAVRTRRRPKPVSPREWSAAAFGKLDRDGASGAALVEGVAAVVRGFIDRHFGVPATKLTTEELLAAAEQAAWPVEHTNPLRRLLDECDRAKFAGDVPDDDECRRLLARGREWVDLVSPEPRPGWRRAPSSP